MKISVLKNLVKTYSVQELIEAKRTLASGLEPKIDLQGDDEGERLTHIIAAVWIQNKITQCDYDFEEALAEYTTKVRETVCE